MLVEQIRGRIAGTLQQHSGVAVHNIPDPDPHRAFAFLRAKGTPESSPRKKSATDNSANDGWKLVFDASVQANSTLPETAIELVSPILSGETRLARVKRVLAVFSDITAQVNPFMGYHIRCNT